MEEIWNFGYRGEVSFIECFWYGTVYAPRWHPIRSKGLVGNPVLMIKGEWTIVEVFDKRQDAAEWVFKTACLLHVMQETWDSLSPYEREYLIW